MHGCPGEHEWLPEGHVWLWGCAWLGGSMHGCWGACVVAGGGMRRIRQDTVNERAVRILPECILVQCKL